MHPQCINTENCDVMILPFNQDPGHLKQVAIPMTRSLLKKIPYFEGQFKNNVDWRETRPQSQTKSVLKLATSKDVDAKTVYSYLENLCTLDQDCVCMEDSGWITKNNCLDVLVLAKYWCDTSVAAEAESFIHKNIDKEMFSAIIKNSELQYH